VDKVLLGFIDVLRRAGIPVGINNARTALEAVSIVGYDDRERMRLALSTVIAADQHERELLDDCFKHYFLSSDNNPTQMPEFADEDSAAKYAPANTAQQKKQAQLEGNDASADLRSDILNDLLAGDDDDLQLAIQQASATIDSDQIRYYTQRGVFTRRLLEALDWPQLQQSIMAMEQGLEEGSGGDGGSGSGLGEVQELSARMLAAARDQIDRQYYLYAKPQTEQLREQRLLTTPIRMLSYREQDSVHKLMQKIARRLNKKYRRRALVHQRGKLDVRATLRRNMAFDATPFIPQWRKKHKDRPQVFVIADISGSVAASAGMLLSFMASLSEILPKVRSFVFSSTMGEVTDLYKQLDIKDATEQANKRWGSGVTDYGRSFINFGELTQGQIRRNSTIIILGDARNNNGDPAMRVFKDIARSCHNIYWLNPERKNIWDTGDSIMSVYGKHCHSIHLSNTLADLEKFCDYLLKNN
jgi:uncharacterized protein with von Willebrand factor type A (vWA) domain